MTKYYKHIDENSKLISLLTYDFKPNITDPLTVEITAEEYGALLAEIQAQASDAEQTYEKSAGEFMEMVEAVL